MAFCVRGRVMGLRKLGGIAFLVVRAGLNEIQVVWRKDHSCAEVSDKVRRLRLGDFVTLLCENRGEDVLLLRFVNQSKMRQAVSPLINGRQVRLLIAYSELLHSLRAALLARGYVEVRLPSIHFGYHKKPCFMLDFFGKPARLTTSNALFLNVLASYLGKVYSLQRVFRAEPSRTSRHLAEFDLLEVATLGDNLENAMRLAEEIIRDTVSRLHNQPLLDPDVRRAVQLPFRHISYDEVAAAFGITANKGLGCFERGLAQLEPVFVENFPPQVASWSAKQVPGGRARSFNLLVPRVGEIAEGNEKNMCLDALKKKFSDLGLDYQLGWYTAHLPYRDCQLSGFGLGVDRLAMWVFGLKNIRELHPFFRDKRFSEIGR